MIDGGEAMGMADAPGRRDEFSRRRFLLSGAAPLSAAALRVSVSGQTTPGSTQAAAAVLGGAARQCADPAIKLC